MEPSGSILPILLASVNQMAPSGPTVIPLGSPSGLVNHRLPLLPRAMYVGLKTLDGNVLIVGLKILERNVLVEGATISSPRDVITKRPMITTLMTMATRRRPAATPRRVVGCSK